MAWILGAEIWELYTPLIQFVLNCITKFTKWQNSDKIHKTAPPQVLHSKVCSQLGVTLFILEAVYYWIGYTEYTV